ncbi:hypothetical protein R1CP_21430 [Rhodococcus opacus]|uniref:Uncharacterized protein n=1 Tax=Rhodococcus opacus TaxID=37919 RepID=A0A1B1K8L4_RHOOP|nr:hypothetical protein [Rhodococcus sp. IEGM 1351]ANS28962.1 hypothetical protein R1CP_21430 [Rhodococcus opacus]
MTRAFRIERDTVGEMPVRSHAYCGVHTARGVENFAIAGTTTRQFPLLISASAMIERAARETNLQLGHLDEKRAGAVINAGKEIRQA